MATALQPPPPDGPARPAHPDSAGRRARHLALLPRVVAVPCCEPPFDDELAESSPEPAKPVAAPALSLVSAAKADGGPRDERPDGNADVVGYRRTPRHELPELRVVAVTYLRALVEISAGLRPLRQATSWLLPEVLFALESELARHTRLAQRDPNRQRAARPVVRSVHVREPDDGVAEVCAVVRAGERCHAVAMRLEGLDGRWRVTALARP